MMVWLNWGEMGPNYLFGRPSRTRILFKRSTDHIVLGEGTGWAVSVRFQLLPSLPALPLVRRKKKSHGKQLRQSSLMT
jgi:hypothetical protein